MKLFLRLIVIHGLIHLSGFVKAFNIVAVNQLSQDISKIYGMFWLLAVILFIFTATLFFLVRWVLVASKDGMN